MSNLDTIYKTYRMIKFSPAILSSRSKIDTFLKQEKKRDLQFLKRKVTPLSHAHPKIRSIWKSVAALFKLITFLSLGALFNEVGKKLPKKWRLYRKCKVYWDLMILKSHNITLKYFSKTKDPLVPCRNIYSKAAFSIALTPDQKLKKIKTLSLFRPDITQRKKKLFTLYHRRGHCVGATIWFHSLFQSLKQKYPKKSDETLLKACAKRFKNGMPSGAVLNQLLSGRFYDARETTFKGFRAGNPEKTLFSSLPKNKSYFLGDRDHVMFFYKGDKANFLLDAEAGLLKYPQTKKGEAKFRSYLRKEYFYDAKAPFKKLAEDWGSQDIFRTKSYKIFMRRSPIPNKNKNPGQFKISSKVGRLNRKAHNYLKTNHLEPLFQETLLRLLKGKKPSKKFERLNQNHQTFLSQVIFLFNAYAPFQYGGLKT